MDFSLTEDEVGPRTVVTVVGDLDVVTAPVLRERLLELVSAGRSRLVADLTGAEFIDSSGLSSMVTAYKAARAVHGEFLVVCPPGHVRRLIEVVSLDQVFDLYDSIGALPG